VQTGAGPADYSMIRIAVRLLIILVVVGENYYSNFTSEIYPDPDVQ